MPIKKLRACLLAAAMTAVLLPTGCKVVNQAPAPANSSETVYYQKWETETHRPHVELNQRTQDEQKEYSEWRRRQDDHR
jgi:hypothetical protein